MTLEIGKTVTESNMSQNQIVIKSNNVRMLRERSDRLAASEASRAVQDWAPRSEAQRSAVQTARIKYLQTHLAEIKRSMILPEILHYILSEAPASTEARKFQRFCW